MKVTKEKAAENRAKLVQAAGRLFRERGIDGVGVAEVCKAAGLTHGALYAQFSSKEALAAAAFSNAFEHGFSRMTAATEPSLTAYLDYLISIRQRDNLGGGCPLTASTSEVARKDENISSRFAQGFEKMVGAVEAVLDQSSPRSDRRDRALTIMATNIGAIAVARATAKSRPDLSNDILVAARRILAEVGGGRSPATKTRRSQPKGRHPRKIAPHRRGVAPNRTYSAG